MDGDVRSRAERQLTGPQEREGADPGHLERELTRVHPDASAAAGAILARIALLRRDPSQWRQAPQIVARERIRVTRSLGSQAARAVDALLVLRSLPGEPLSISAPLLRAWAPFAVAVLDDRYAANPVFTMPSIGTHAGRIEWIHRSMRLYFCVGLFWCERTGVPRRWLLQTRGRDRLRLARYLIGEFRAARPVFATHLPPLEHGRHLTAEDFVADHIEIARHMTLERRIRGLGSASWFYDPLVPSVSPHLAFIGSTLDSGGCIRFELPTDPHAVEDALRTSRRRRAAYEAGEYRPRVFGRLWPRERFLRWAGSTELERIRGASISDK